MQKKGHKWRLSLGAGLIWSVSASRWLLTAGLSPPCFLFTATLAVNSRVHLYTRLMKARLCAIKSLWNYITSTLWTTCKWKLSQCSRKCHLPPPPCLLSCSLAAGRLRNTLVNALDWSAVQPEWEAMETPHNRMSVKAERVTWPCEVSVWQTLLFCCCFILTIMFLIILIINIPFKKNIKSHISWYEWLYFIHCTTVIINWRLAGQS